MSCEHLSTNKQERNAKKKDIDNDEPPPYAMNFYVIYPLRQSDYRSVTAFFFCTLITCNIFMLSIRNQTDTMLLMEANK